MIEAPNPIIHPESLDDLINYIVYRTARIMRMKFRRDMQAAGMELTQEQYFIMFRLWEKDGQTQTELSDDLFRDNPNISRILDNLEKKGYINRLPDHQDRRICRVCLTETGRRLQRTYRENAPTARRGDYADLTLEDLGNLKRILRRIEENITAQMDPGRSEPE